MPNLWYVILPSLPKLGVPRVRSNFHVLFQPNHSIWSKDANLHITKQMLTTDIVHHRKATVKHSNALQTPAQQQGLSEEDYADINIEEELKVYYTTPLSKPKKEEQLPKAGSSKFERTVIETIDNTVISKFFKRNVSLQFQLNLIVTNFRKLHFCSKSYFCDFCPKSHFDDFGQKSTIISL